MPSGVAQGAHRLYTGVGHVWAEVTSECVPVYTSNHMTYLALYSVYLVLLYGSIPFHVAARAGVLMLESQYSAIQYSTVQCSIVQYRLSYMCSTIQYTQYSLQGILLQYTCYSTHALVCSTHTVQYSVPCRVSYCTDLLAQGRHCWPEPSLTS